MNYRRKKVRSVLSLCLVAAVLGACSGSGPGSRYTLAQDRGPDHHVDLSRVPDAVPRMEPRSRGGNRSPYQVWGKQYYVMASSAGYRKQGTASWYGKKFHGHKTANGEIYDMYAMTAAHRSLPLPSYVRVTNLDNNRSVIVRVNDRGPFHGSRLIDLSYAAAYRLGMLKKGTARVEVQAIAIGKAETGKLARPGSPKDGATVAGGAERTVSATAPGRYLQVGAYSTLKAAERVKSQLEPLAKDLRVIINQRQGTKPVYRVQMGPVDRLATLDGLYQVLRNAGFPDPRVVDLH